METALERAVDYSRAGWIRKIFQDPFRTGRMVGARILRKLPKPPQLSIRVETQLFTGDPLTVVLPEDISTALYSYGYFEENVTRMMVSHLKPGMTVFDVGAHMGYFSRLALTLVGETGQVHAFEPTPRTFEILQTNFRNSPNVYLNNQAVWSHRQRLTLKDYGIQLAGLNSFTAPRILSNTKDPARAQPRPTEFQVDALSLDDYVAEFKVTPDFIKIDAESAEYPILTGMQRTLQDLRPLVVLEVGDLEISEAISSRTLIQYMMAHHYQAYHVREGRLGIHHLQQFYEPENLLFLPKEY